jgi:carboxymethylenebutenolidase
MSSRVHFETPRGAGAAGQLSEPVEPTVAPGLLAVHGSRGLDDHALSLVHRFAHAGFIVLAPDLYGGEVARTAADAERMMGALQWDAALDQLEGAIRVLETHPRSSGKVAAVGFCIGGALAIAAASRLTGLSAVVSFYGLPAEGHAETARIQVPVLAHIAERDPWARVGLALELQQRVRDAGGEMDVCVYQAGHAFLNDSRPEAYEAVAATLAWDRTVFFLRRHLG